MSKLIKGRKFTNFQEGEIKINHDDQEYNAFEVSRTGMKARCSTEVSLGNTKSVLEIKNDQLHLGTNVGAEADNYFPIEVDNKSVVIRNSSGNIIFNNSTTGGNAPGGIPTLDDAGKLPLSTLPVNTLVNRGVIDATAIFEKKFPSNGEEFEAGDFYIVSTAGSAIEPYITVGRTGVTEADNTVTASDPEGDGKLNLFVGDWLLCTNSRKHYGPSVDIDYDGTTWTTTDASIVVGSGLIISGPTNNDDTRYTEAARYRVSAKTGNELAFTELDGTAIDTPLSNAPYSFQHVQTKNVTEQTITDSKTSEELVLMAFVDDATRDAMRGNLLIRDGLEYEVADATLPDGWTGSLPVGSFVLKRGGNIVTDRFSDMLMFVWRSDPAYNFYEYTAKFERVPNFNLIKHAAGVPEESADSQPGELYLNETNKALYLQSGDETGKVWKRLGTQTPADCEVTVGNATSSEPYDLEESEFTCRPRADLTTTLTTFMIALVPNDATGLFTTNHDINYRSVIRNPSTGLVYPVKDVTEVSGSPVSYTFRLVGATDSEIVTFPDELTIVELVTTWAPMKYLFTACNTHVVPQLMHPQYIGKVELAGKKGSILSGGDSNNPLVFNSQPVTTTVELMSDGNTITLQPGLETLNEGDFVFFESIQREVETIAGTTITFKDLEATALETSKTYRVDVIRAAPISDVVIRDLEIKNSEVKLSAVQNVRIENVILGSLVDLEFCSKVQFSNVTFKAGLNLTNCSDVRITDCSFDSELSIEIGNHVRVFGCTFNNDIKVNMPDPLTSYTDIHEAVVDKKYFTTKNVAITNSMFIDSQTQIGFGTKGLLISDTRSDSDSLVVSKTADKPADTATVAHKAELDNSIQFSYYGVM